MNIQIKNWFIWSTADNTEHWKILTATVNVYIIVDIEYINKELIYLKYSWQHRTLKDSYSHCKCIYYSWSTKNALDRPKPPQLILTATVNVYIIVDQRRMP